MADNSAIEWTNATWNPTTGCDKISPGCKNCYAERISYRYQFNSKQPKYKKGFKFAQHSKELERPFLWKRPRKIFVNSMSDLFHKNAEMEFVGKCFFTMLKAHWHTYQILTKRPEKMAEFSRLFSSYFGFPIPNHIWMGVSVENNDTTWRIAELKKVNCYNKFISFEPLLENLKPVNLNGIDWAIIGGESGPRYRPIEKQWILDLIKQCKKQKVKVFFKQWGGTRPKTGGRTINGRTYDEFPKLNAMKPLHQKKLKLIQESKQFAPFMEKAVLTVKAPKRTSRKIIH